MMVAMRDGGGADRSTLRRLLFATAGVLMLSFAGAAGLWVVYLWPGGVRPTYNAVDHDLLLTYRARSAKQIIEGVERYRLQHGDYAPDLAALAPSEAMPAATTEIHGWGYTASADGYTLSSRLGWDPSLEYVVEGAASRWVFSPGDGSPDKTIVLRS